jgi:leucyl aminopeptidase
MISLFTILENEFLGFIETCTQFEKNFILASGFKGQAKKILNIPDENGKIAKVVLGMGTKFDVQCFGYLGRNIEAGDYEIKSPIEKENSELAYLFFLLGAYFYGDFKTNPRKVINLKFPNLENTQDIEKAAKIINKGRDLVNSPANIMGPNRLGEFAIEIGQKYDCQIEQYIGDELIANNYPLIHAVGRASSQAPRFIILRKPKANAPKIGIIGKGVIFDTGGLNIKTGNFMGIMKKDMGGAACALTLFQLLLDADFNLDINLYLPIVENSIASNAMRPGDIVKSRKGLSVEIDNTDAEGRLILADALTRASEDKMDLMLDFATLTGAARVALGPELPPFYSNNEQLIQDINKGAQIAIDPVWNMPLWKNYCDDLESPVADLKNGGGAFAGSMTAALFLEKFVDCNEWAHFDVYCWNPKEKPIGPMGGEIQAIRGVFATLKARFAA